MALCLPAIAAPALLALGLFRVTRRAHQAHTALRRDSVGDWRVVVDLASAEYIPTPGAPPRLLVHERFLLAFRDGFAPAHQHLVDEFVAHHGAPLAPVVELQAELVLHLLTKRSKLQVLWGHSLYANT